MKRRNLTRAVLLASVTAVAVGGLFVQPAAAQGRSVPTFEVDKAWPKLPANMKIGDASSFSADAQDNIYLIHRPRTLKGDDLKNAAKAIVAPGAAKATATTGRSASTASPSITRATSGSAATTVPRPTLPTSNQSPTTPI